MRIYVFSVFAVAASLSPALAQDVENAVLRARDAFGERVGNEQIGLYSESQVRGFNLGDTGAYRIEGSYFIRQFGLPDSILQGVSVKVGVAAARLDYPSPSGVVEYRIKSSNPGDNKAWLTVGFRENHTRIFDANWSYATDDGTYRVVASVVGFVPQNFQNGTSGDGYAVGLMPQWHPTDKISIRGVFGADTFPYNGDITITSSVAAPPPKIGRRNIGAPFAHNLRENINTGVLADAEFSQAWSASATVFYTDVNRAPQDVTLLNIAPDRTADVTFVRTEQDGNALTGEAILRYAFQTGTFLHELNVAGRGRRSRDVTAQYAPVRLGRIDTNVLNYGPEPAFGPLPAPTLSNVDQTIGSVGYVGVYGAFELRGGLHRTHYVKTVTTPAGVVTRRPQNTWFYNSSVVYSATTRTTLFGNAVRGVEESGLAPQNALNRGEILPPVTTQEYELGVRYALRPQLNFSVAGFQTTKPIAGVRPDGIYSFVGDARHRGIELSLAGEVVRGTNVVAGALLMQPRLSGVLVDAGTIANRPVGVSSTVAFASINQALPWAPGWSVDSRAQWQGPRPANARNSFGVKGVALWAVGGRYSFAWAGNPMLLRFEVSNIAGGGEHQVNGAGVFTQYPPTTFRLLLRVDFNNL